MIKPLFSIYTRWFPRFAVLFFLLFFAKPLAWGQPPQIKLKFNLKNYIQQYSDEAVKQMIEYRIPASVILAQAIFESGSGTSHLATSSNNHFGIKCHEEWMGDTFTMDDDTLNECFRKYPTVEESFTDHSLFLITRPRYAYLFELALNDYAGWCYGLKNAGYATYPTYAEDLIKLIEDEKLYELDNVISLQSRPLAKALKKFQDDISHTKLKTTGFSLQDFSKDGFIWLDEKDVLVQSLDMIVDAGYEEDISVASEK